MPLINKCRKNFVTDTSQLCEQVDNFLVTQNGLSAILTWTKPENDQNNSFVGVRIVRKEGSCPTNINDGIIIYEGSGADIQIENQEIYNYTDTNLTEGVTYYYRAFAYNSEGKYQTSMRYGSITAVNIPESFVLASWEQIITACQANTVPDTWAVGDSKDMTINGTSYTIDIIGKNHDTYSDGSGTAPLTFQLHDCYGTGYAMHSSNSTIGGWTSCNMRSTHLPSILTKMPNEVRSAISEVNKLTSAGNASSIINTTADKLFLLSEVEVFGTTDYSFTGEGSQYEYYSAGNSAKKIFGTNNRWWLRSPYKSDNGIYCYVNYNNKKDVPYYPFYNAATSTYGVAFAFCF